MLIAPLVWRTEWEKGTLIQAQQRYRLSATGSKGKIKRNRDRQREK